MIDSGFKFLKNLLTVGILYLLPISVNAQNALPILGEKPQKFIDEFVPEPSGVEVEVWVEGLHIPWSLLFLPNGDALVAQRTGEIMKINGKNQSFVDTITPLKYPMDSAIPIKGSSMSFSCSRLQTPV